MTAGEIITWSTCIIDICRFCRISLGCKALLLILTNCGGRNNKMKNKKNAIKFAFSSFGSFCVHFGPNENHIQKEKIKKKK